MELQGACRMAAPSGVVIESSLDKGRGPVATVLVQQGTLKKGDFLVCGIEYGRVRALFDETGKQVDEAGPSIPVQVLGLSGVPNAGDDFVVVADERLAKDVAQQRQHKRRETRLVKAAGNRMEDIMAQMGQGEGQQTLNLVVKADVQGSAEALRDSLTAIVDRRDQDQRDRVRRRRHHRIRRDARRRVEGRHHRLQRARRRVGAQGDRRATTSTCATSRSSTT